LFLLLAVIYTPSSYLLLLLHPHPNTDIVGQQDLYLRTHKVALSDNNNPGFSAVAQTNKTKMQTVAANNLSTTTNTTKPSSSIVDTFSESGTINSLIYLSSGDNNSTLGAAKKFILFGDWNLIVNKGVVRVFQAKFINVLPDGTRWHTHGLVNLKTDNITKIHLNGDNSISISGTVDIN
jgi:hypothetical protein